MSKKAVQSNYGFLVLTIWFGHKLTDEAQTELILLNMIEDAINVPWALEQMPRDRSYLPTRIYYITERREGLSRYYHLGTGSKKGKYAIT